jgi:hypothetical protein
MTRRTIPEQWHDYGSRPPIARWTARTSLIVGVAFSVVVTLAILSGAIWLIVIAWRAIL